MSKAPDGAMEGSGFCPAMKSRKDWLLNPILSPRGELLFSPIIYALVL
jgi:hypothetical protein